MANFGEHFGIPKDSTPIEEKTPAQRAAKGLDLNPDEAGWMAGNKAPEANKTSVEAEGHEEPGHMDKAA